MSTVPPGEEGINVPTVQPRREDPRHVPSPERLRIVLDGSFLAAVRPAGLKNPPLARADGSRLAERGARVWRAVLLALTTVTSLAMIVFALLKAIPLTALSMVALVAVKVADHWHSRRLTRSMST
ncbi:MULTISPECIES: hypothetical protein [Amycolatopsis]|uniref:DUF3040 domain-containing protein n=1 Tax=Amycolatopsis tucumanensis TaxID=401106 RepID=A0ABP7IC46_9PSEU|nr:hypothetical protein [Amycolatopsis tucumanensis]MCF6422587.1 hypothetical protein [Amycolatopsis tucumanensis]